MKNKKKFLERGPPSHPPPLPLHVSCCILVKITLSSRYPTFRWFSVHLAYLLLMNLLSECFICDVNNEAKTSVWEIRPCRPGEAFQHLSKYPVDRCASCLLSVWAVSNIHEVHITAKTLFEIPILPWTQTRKAQSTKNTKFTHAFLT